MGYVGKQLFTDNLRQCWLCGPDGKIWGSGLEPLLALEDTTTLTFNHASVRGELGHINQASSRALLAHSVLLFAPHERKVVGLAAQQMGFEDQRNENVR